MRRALLVTALLLAGCSNAQDPRTAYQRGVAALAAGDARTARVEFMNVLNADPGNKAARVMQARTHLALGDGVAAEAEIGRARLNGVDLAQSRALMAHALLLQGRNDEASAELKQASGAYAERVRGLLFAATGKTDEAEAAFERAAALAPDDADLWIDVARFRRSAGALGGALAAADRAVAANPRSGEAVMLRGELSRSQYGLRAAVPWFDRAIEIDPKNVDPRLERAATLGDLGATREMLDETRRVLFLAPDNAMAFYLQAALAARAGKFDLAKSLYQRTQGKLDGQPAGMLLASAIALETGAPDAAVARLSPLLDQQPDNDKVRRLLAVAKWRAGDASGAVQTLRRLADRPNADSYSLSLMATALLKLKDGEGAAAYLARASSPGARPAAALLASPPDGSELAALRSDAASGEAEAQVRLIRALLSAGLGGEASSRARALQAAHPDVPDVHILVGDSLGIQGQFAAAAEQYRRAANIAFTEPTAMRMIEAYERSGQSDKAAQVLALFLDQNPRNVAAQLLSAARLVEARRWSDAIEAYERLRRQIGDSDAVVLNNLAWAYSEEGDYARALPLARKAWAMAPANAATTDTFGWLLYKSGKGRAQGLALLQQANAKAKGGR